MSYGKWRPCCLSLNVLNISNLWHSSAKVWMTQLWGLEHWKPTPFRFPVYVCAKLKCTMYLKSPRHPHTPAFFFFRANHSVTGLEITLSCTRFVSPCILLWCEELFYSWNILYLWICMHFMRMMLLFAVWYVDIKMYFMIAKVLIYCMYFYKDVLNFNHCYGWGWMEYWMCLNLVMPDEEKLGGFCQQSAYTWNCYVCILLMFSVYNYNGAKSVVISVDIT